MPIVRTFLLLRPSVGKAAVGCLSSSSNLWLVLIIRRRRKTNLRFNPQLAFPLDLRSVWFLFLLLQPFGWSPFLHSWYSTFGWEGKVKKKKQIREPDHDFFEVKGDVRRLVFNQSCSSNTNRLVSFMVWITNLLSSPFIQPSVGHFGNLISSHEVLPKCMKGEERKGKDSWRLEVDSWLIPTVDWSLKTKLLKAFLILDLRSPWEVVNGWKSSRNLYSLSSSTHIHIRFTHDNRRLGLGSHTNQSILTCVGRSPDPRPSWVKRMGKQEKTEDYQPWKQELF